MNPSPAKTINHETKTIGTTSAFDAGPLEELTAKYGDIKKAEGFKYSNRTKPAAVFKRKER